VSERKKFETANPLPGLVREVCVRVRVRESARALVCVYSKDAASRLVMVRGAFVSRWRART
jgi:hypothetical protein